MSKNKKEFIKKIRIPLTQKELKLQHNFIHFLKENNVNTADIINLYYVDSSYTEVQENIIGNHDVNIDDFIKTLANFHKISKKYKGEVKKEKEYNISFLINNVYLDKVLIGYDEKFNIYPLNNYKNNIRYISFFNRIKTNFLTKQYLYMYKCIKNKFKDNYCIIHNDISLNNIICKKNEIFLIDFDLCTSSYEVVDIADAILTQYNSIEDILFDIKTFKKNIIKYCNEYKKINNININSLDIIYQIEIKIISFYYYIMLNNTNKKIFNKNIKKIYKIVKVVNKNEYYN